jgi:hypothetical protein
MMAFPNRRLSVDFCRIDLASIGQWTRGCFGIVPIASDLRSHRQNRGLYKMSYCDLYLNKIK